MSQSPEQLAQLLAAKTDQTFEQLYSAVAPVMLGYLVRIVRSRAVAEECLQEAFVRIWMQASSFDYRRANVMAWMLSIARNHAIDRLRRSKLEAKFGAYAQDSTIADRQPVWSRVFVLNLHLGLESLTAAQQQYLQMAYVDGATHAEIAQCTGAPIGSVKSSIRRGLEVLRRGIGDDNPRQPCNARRAAVIR